MGFTILQMPISLWHKDHIFFNEKSEVHIINYVSVYQGDLPDEYENDRSRDLEACDYLFKEFNINHPANYASRSLSPGDVIMIEDGFTPAKYYLCCSIGWTELKNFTDSVSI